MDQGSDTRGLTRHIRYGEGMACASPLPAGVVLFERGCQANAWKSTGTSAFRDSTSQVIPEDLSRQHNIQFSDSAKRGRRARSAYMSNSGFDKVVPCCIRRFLAMLKVHTLRTSRPIADSPHEPEVPPGFTYFSRRQCKLETADWLHQQQSDFRARRLSPDFNKRDIRRFYTKLSRDLVLRSKSFHPIPPRFLEYRPKLIMVGSKLVEIHEEERALLIQLFNEFESLKPGNIQSHTLSLERLISVIESKEEWREVYDLVMKELDLLVQHNAGFSHTSGLRLRIRNCMYSLLL